MIENENIAMIMTISGTVVGVLALFAFIIGFSINLTAVVASFLTLIAAVGFVIFGMCSLSRMYEERERERQQQREIDILD